jgi:hypothetical protein
VAVLELPLEAARAWPGAGQGEADPGGGDDLEEPGAASGGVLARREFRSVVN